VNPTKEINLLMLLLDLWNRLSGIWRWSRMCDTYVEGYFLTAVAQSCCRNIQPYVVSSTDFSL